VSIEASAPTPGDARRASRIAARRRAARTFFRHRMATAGAVYLVVLFAAIAFHPYLGLPDPNRINLARQFAPPSAEHLLGTDENGRDVLSRLIAGGRISVTVGLVGAVLTVLVASVVGVTAGFFGGWVDQAIMRLTDGFMAIPTFFLLLIIVTIWGSSATILVLALALTRWMGVARLVRSEVLRFKEMEFVTAARSLGASNLRLMAMHLLPQAAPSLIVATSLNVGIVMLVEAGLSFLGLGILPPTPSWGNMLTASQYYMWMAPHLAVYPGLLIFLAVLAFNSLGDVLRDILDPRQRAGA
jgi:peptide/nickel transport system permease protein